MTILLNTCNFIGNYTETSIAIRDVDDYIKKESFNIPIGQELPDDHYECKGFLVVGDKRSGKTLLTTKELALKAWEIWGQNIDFIIAEDVYALIDAVASSKCAVHYVVLDDQAFYLDARNPMGNRRITQVYFTIAHELQKRAKLMKGNQGGLVICPILVQNYSAIDLRLRSDMMFTIFKTYDESGCRYYNLNNSEVEPILKDWKIRSNRLTDYEARKNAFIIDINMEGCIIKFDANDPKYKDLPFEFKIIRGVDRYKEQRDKLVEWLCINLPLYDCSDAKLKGELFYKLDEISTKRENVYITKSNFMEIIYRARHRFEEISHKKVEEKRREQINLLIEFLYKTFDINTYQDAELKGEIFYKIDEWIDKKEHIFIKPKDLSEIIFKAKKKNRDIHNIEQQKEDLNPRNKSLKDRMVALFKNVKSIYALQELYKEFEKDYTQPTIRKTLNNNRDIFMNLSKIKELNLNRGVYCLVGYKYTTEELEPYLAPINKRLKP